jgi:hypothetical protein
VYELQILICLMSGQCMEVIDLKGPYESKQICVDRAYELSTELRREATQPITFAYKCVRQTEA